MSSFWKLENVKAALGGSWLARPSQDSAGGTGLAGACIDSRQLKPGQVFFAFRGEKVDGHAFVESVLAAGAGLAVVDRPESLPEGLLRRVATTNAIVQVPDVGAALLRLAAAYRKTLDMTRVIAVGGSNGKTTTTRLIQQVLSSSLRGVSSPKSFNNSIGVPYTILQAKRTDQYLVCEVGTNAPGEIAALAEVIQPDVAVITSIGREHLELLGSLEGVAREEASLLRWLRPNGCAVLNADAPFLAEAARRAFGENGSQEHTLVRFGTAAEAEFRISDVTSRLDGVEFQINGNLAVKLPMLGLHNAHNAAAACAVGRRLGLTQEQILAGLAQARGPEMRMELNHLALAGGQVTIINDAYNANPDSVTAGLQTFAALAGDAAGARRVVVLGDMLELGADGPMYHQEIGRLLADLGCADLAIFVGELMTHACAAASPGFAAGVCRSYAAGAESAIEIASLFEPGDLVYLKGSRGMALERVLKAAKDRSLAGASVIVSGQPRAAV